MDQGLGRSPHRCRALPQEEGGRALALALDQSACTRLSRGVKEVVGAEARAWHSVGPRSGCLPVLS